MIAADCVMVGDCAAGVNQYFTYRRLDLVPLLQLSLAG